MLERLLIVMCFTLLLGTHPLYIEDIYPGSRIGVRIDSPDSNYYAQTLPSDASLLVVVDLINNEIIPCKLKKITEFDWFPDSERIAISTILDQKKSGIHIWYIKRGKYKQIFYNKNGAQDYIRVASVKEDGSKIFFFYKELYFKSEDFSSITKDDLYIINVDGTNFQKYDRK